MAARTSHAEDPRAKGAKPPFAEPPQQGPGSTAKMRTKPDHGEASYRGLGRLAGKVALITGADSGIGRAVAIAFAREGADVAFGYAGDPRGEEEADAEETERWIHEAGRASLRQAGDLAKEETSRALVEATVKRFGRIDVLVNDAAYQGKAVERFEDLDGARVRQTFLVNVVAMYDLVRFALPHMKPGSAIVNVASIQAYKPSWPILDYAGTKGAIVTFTKGLAQALIERGIRVNCVAPGPVWTPLVAQSFGEEKLRHFGEDAPMERPAQPAELAPAFVFLACDEARYVNGEVLGVTGGKPLA